MAGMAIRWKRGIISFFSLLLLLWGTGNIFAAERADEGEPVGRVLFISSYSYAWKTVPQQIAGIKESLGDDVVLDFKFMDTKNIDTGESERLFYESMQYFIKQVPEYDVVIVGDDAAFHFVLDHRQELFEGIPIIFEGVNNTAYAVEAAESGMQITGVLENLSYGDTIALASRLCPKATQVVAVLDDTVTGVGERIEFYKYAGMFPELGFWEINASELPQEELNRQVAELGEESILLYIMCSEDGDGNTYASEEAVTMLSKSANVPVFAFTPIGMGKGFLGGEIVSQKQMGVIAGNMARQVLEGTDPAQIEMVMDSPKTYCFDENVMKRFDIEKSQLPQNVEIINHTETFWERNVEMIWISMFVGAVLLVLIVILLKENARGRKTNHAMNEANEVLNVTARHDPLTSLLNRRSFMEDLERRTAGSEAFGIIMFDMDNFKNVNDIYGHNVGDEVLKELAARSAGVSDEICNVYRLAGDEFVAIVSDGQREVTESYAMQLRESLRGTYWLDGKERVLSCSIGMAMWPEDAESATALLAVVDKAMYAVKNGGKDGMAFYRKGM